MRQRNLVVAMAQGYRQVGAFTGDQYATVRADALYAILRDADRYRLARVVMFDGESFVGYDADQLDDELDRRLLAARE